MLGTMRLIEEILQDLTAKSAVARQCAVRGLAQIGGPKEIPILCSILRTDIHPRVRASAALTLGLIPDTIADETAIASLSEAMLNDPCSHVRVMAAGALYVLSLKADITRDKALIQACLEALQDPDWHVVVPTVRILEQASLGQIENSLLSLLDHPEWWVRLTVVDSLVSKGYGSETLFKALDRLENECEESMLNSTGWQWDENENQSEMSLKAFLDTLRKKIRASREE